MGMKYFIRKIVTLIITLLFISMLSFAAFSVIPGNAAISKLGTDATPERVAALEASMGLDKPMVVRYGNWLRDALHGDFSESYQYEGVRVSELLAQRLPTTIILALLSLVIILVLSIPLGILSAKYSGKWLDTLINQLTQITMAIPAFFLGIILTYIFGIALKWFQVGKFVSLNEDPAGCIKYLIFPALAIALPKLAMVVKFLRNSVLGEMQKDYVRTAYSKGNDKNKVLYRHILKNALIPVITFTAMIIAEIMAGSIIVEQVFSVPGIGRLLVSSISNRDYPVVQAMVIYITAIVIIINFIVDMLYQLADPRVRAQ
jgi:peptide/nickel transport system permease protein